MERLKHKQGRVVAIILAGGLGKRMGTKTPKQFLKLAGKPIIIYSLQTFSKCGFISDIVVVSHKDYIKRTENLIKKYKIPKVYKVVKGGPTRQISSYNGLKVCPPGTEYVLIHDAARPFVNTRVIRDTLIAAKKVGASGAAIDTDDTIVVIKGEFIKTIPNRKIVKRIQTPQGFRYDAALKAHDSTRKNKVIDCTDDCGLVLADGGVVKVVQGCKCNIKITDKSNFAWCEGFLQKKYL